MPGSTNGSNGESTTADRNRGRNAGRERSRRRFLQSTAVAGAAVAGFGTLSGTAAAEFVVDDRPVRVDQVGYLPDAAKMAVVLEDTETFEVKDATTGEVVYEGSVSAPMDDPASGQTVRHATFSDVTTPGEYVVAVDGGTSYPFRIAEDVYDEALATMGRLFTLKRAGTRIEDPITGVEIGPGHTQDANAAMAAPDDAFYDEGEPLDVSGGWYDAGDYGKYVTPTAISVGCLLFAYERNPEAFSVGQFDVPDSVDDPHVGTMPDVLVECRTALEWLEAMQRPDGGLYYTVAGLEFPEMETRPAEDGMDRYVFGLSSAGTAMAAAAFARAARLYADHQPAFADRMLANAEDAFDFLEANPDVVWREDPGQNEGSGAYTRSEDEEDRFWAAAELLKTTGEDQYAEYIESELSHLFSEGPVTYDWTSGFTIGLWAYRTADASDPSRTAQIEDEIVGWAYYILEESIQGDGYNNALDSYYWGCLKNGVGRGHVLLLANEIQPNDAFVEAAMDQLHHLFGRSATGFSYVTGIGTLTPENPHDRIVESTGTVLPGMVVGGPNESAPQEGDDSGDYIDPDTPPALSYVDVTGSYATNEWAINYSAPVVLLVSEFVDLEDGDDGPIQVGDYEAQDPDGDGLYDDVTGDGRTNHEDVQAFYEHIDAEGVQNNPTAFDFDEDGRVGFADVLELLEEL
ncbi:glycoside hydrolase family 9 protein [Halopiger goleimassiliensis]|uniref:glycoside hydrolase family 9 protein n=1 Tax=Halopiger goleimassiliensis TaxID=1293048 RepID=UPI000677B4F3|nr:glycoside hydrolase family 9 protein [Halopiger goleimassiliensis]